MYKCPQVAQYCYLKFTFNLLEVSQVGKRSFNQNWVFLIYRLLSNFPMRAASCLDNANFFLTMCTPTLAQLATQAELSSSQRKPALLLAQLNSSQADQTNSSARLAEKLGWLIWLSSSSNLAIQDSTTLY